MKTPKFPTIKDVAALVRHVKSQVPRKSEAAAEDYIDRFSGQNSPSIDLTIGFNPETSEWSWQTGDNSFTGGAYGYPVWAVTSIYKTDNSTRVAKDLISQLEELTCT